MKVKWISYVLLVTVLLPLIAVERGSREDISYVMEAFFSGGFKTKRQLEVRIQPNGLEPGKTWYPNEDLHIYMRKYGDLTSAPDGSWVEDPAELQFRLHPDAVADYQKQYGKTPESLFCQSDVSLIYNLYREIEETKPPDAIGDLPDLTKEVELNGNSYVTLESIERWELAPEVLEPGPHPARLIIACWAREPEDKDMELGTLRDPDYMGQIMFALHVKTEEYESKKTRLNDFLFMKKNKLEMDRILKKEKLSKSYWAKKDWTLLGKMNYASEHVSQVPRVKKGTRVYVTRYTTRECKWLSQNAPEGCNVLYGITEEGRRGILLSTEFSEEFVPKD